MAERGEPIRIGVRELRGKLGAYLRQVKGGARFLIVSHGEPVAELSAPTNEEPERRPRQPGGLKGRIRMADDWDEWPPEILESFEKPL
jgi:antitoxin (DNA-binding transcriptional repressor) of toxin-antitoxin stability system